MTVLFFAGAGAPPSGGVRAPARARPVASPLPPTPAPELPAAGPVRDLFRYGDAPAETRPAAPVSRPLAPKPVTAVTLPPIRPVRLVGLLRRGAGLKAALVFGSELHMLGAGESAGGYQVLSLDEDAGVRLRGPDGTEFVLSPPGS